MGQTGSICGRYNICVKACPIFSHRCDGIGRGVKSHGRVLLYIFEISYFAARKEHLQSAFNVAKIKTTSYSFRFVALD